jgi:hypothetical protein
MEGYCSTGQSPQWAVVPVEEEEEEEEEEDSRVKFHENLSSGSRNVKCGRTDGRKEKRIGGQTDITKPIVAYRNFVNALSNWSESLNRDTRTTLAPLNINF